MRELPPPPPSSPAHPRRVSPSRAHARAHSFSFSSPPRPPRPHSLLFPRSFLFQLCPFLSAGRGTSWLSLFVPPGFLCTFLFSALALLLPLCFVPFNSDRPFAKCAKRNLVGKRVKKERGTEGGRQRAGERERETRREFPGNLERDGLIIERSSHR